MSKDLCVVCNGIFIDDQKLNQEQPHHRTAAGFLDAAKNGCYICKTITKSSEWERLATQDILDTVWHLSQPAGSPAGFFRLTIDNIGDDDEESSGSDRDTDEDDGGDSDKDSSSSKGQDLAAPAAWAFHLQLAKGQLRVQNQSLGTPY